MVRLYVIGECQGLTIRKLELESNLYHYMPPAFFLSPAVVTYDTGSVTPMPPKSQNSNRLHQL